MTTRDARSRGSRIAIRIAAASIVVLVTAGVVLPNIYVPNGIHYTPNFWATWVGWTVALIVPVVTVGIGAFRSFKLELTGWVLLAVMVVGAYVG